MGKRVKKNRIVTEKSPVLYALGKMAGTFSLNEIRKWMDDRRSMVNKYIKVQNVDIETGKPLSDGPWENGLMFPENSKINSMNMDADKGQDYLSFVQAMSEGVWMADRKVYEISEFALEYIESDDPCFADERGAMNFCQVKMPCCVTFPDGTGFFYSVTTMRNDLFNQSEHGEKRKPDVFYAKEYMSYPVFFVWGIGDYEDILLCGRVRGRSTMEDLCNLRFPCIHTNDMVPSRKKYQAGTVLKDLEEDIGEELHNRLRRIFRTLFYLSYLENLMPMEYDRMHHEMVTEGSPSMTKVKIKGMEPGWNLCPAVEGYNLNTYGLHAHMGFLSAATFREFMRNVRTSDEMLPYFATEELFLGYRSFAMWPEHGTTFSFSNKTLASLDNRYTGKLQSINWPELLAYIPMRELLLSYPDLREGCIVVIGPDTLGLTRLDRESDSTRLIPYDQLDYAKDKKILVSLAHLGTYYKLREEKAAEVQKQPSSHSQTNNIPSVSVKAKEPSITTPSYDVSVEALLLYDVTERSIKRVRDNRRIPCGWTVIPHVRREHVHRYWVGSGENRHLEARTVQQIIVNKDKDPTAAIHHVT